LLGLKADLEKSRTVTKDEAQVIITHNVKSITFNFLRCFYFRQWHVIST